MGATDILSGVAAGDDYARLALAVKARREALRLTIEDAAEGADVSENTWIRVEAGRRARGLSYAGIDEALAWRAGSCRAVLGGGDPTPIQSPALDDNPYRKDAEIALDWAKGLPAGAVRESLVALITEQLDTPPAAEDEPERRRETG